METAQVVTVSIAALMCTIAIGTILWRLAATVERVSLLVERLTRDLDAHGTRLAHVETTRPSETAVRASMDALRVELERDHLRRANEPRQMYESARTVTVASTEPERSLRGRK